MRINSEEAALIRKTIDTASRGEWSIFRELSDEPFLNESAMQEQFEMASVEIRSMSNPKTTASLQRGPKGSRMIYVDVVDKNTSSKRVQVILHSVVKEDGCKIGIWVFAPMPN